jgi:hypothetical protein
MDRIAAMILLLGLVLVRPQAANKELGFIFVVSPAHSWLGYLYLRSLSQSMVP